MLKLSSLPNDYLLDIANEHMPLRMLSFLLMMFYAKESIRNLLINIIILLILDNLNVEIY
jgi:hypothetical protein